MFELLDKRSPFMPTMSRRAVVCGILTGAFPLGFLTGVLLAHALPFDPIRIVSLVFFLVWTVWWVVVAFRRETTAHSENQIPTVSRLDSNPKL
jgi:hypothetical protein